MSTLSEYAARVAKYEPFTPEQERLVFKRVAAGDKAARERAILHNTRLAIAYTRKYIHINRDMSAEDLLQQAMLGIIRAVDMFDVTMGTRFSTFATESMHYLITRYLQNHKNLVRVPANKFGTETGMVDANLLDLDSPLRDEAGLTLGETVADTNDSFQSFESEQFWAEVVKPLTEREAQAILLRFREGLLLNEVGERMGVSTARADQLEKAALKKLRAMEFAA